MNNDNNQNGAAKDEKEKDIDKSVYDIKTNADLESLSFEERIKYDKSNFLQYFLYLVKVNIDFVSIIAISSAIDPFSLRFTKFMFNITLNLALNAVFYFDTYIEEETDMKNSGSDLQFNYFIYNQIIKTLWSVLISYIIIFASNMIIIVSHKYLNQYYLEALTDKVNAM